MPEALKAWEGLVSRFQSEEGFQTLGRTSLVSGCLEVGTEV